MRLTLISIGLFLASSLYGVSAQTLESAANHDSAAQSCLKTCWAEKQRAASARLNQCTPQKNDAARASCMSSTQVDMTAERESCRSSCLASHARLGLVEPEPDFPEGHDPLKKPEGYEYEYWTDEKARSSSIRGPEEFTTGVQQ